MPGLADVEACLRGPLIAAVLQTHVALGGPVMERVVWFVCLCVCVCVCVCVCLFVCVRKCGGVVWCSVV